MADRSVRQKEMTSVKISLRFSQANHDAAFIMRIESTVVCMKRALQSIRAELGNKTVMTPLGKLQPTNTLSKAMNRGLMPKLAEDEVPAGREGKGNVQICVQRGAKPKEPLLPKTTSRTEQIVCLPRGGIPQRDSPEGPGKLLIRDHTKEELNTTLTPPLHATAERRGTYYYLSVDGRIGQKPCLVTVDTGSTMTIVRPDTAEGLPERERTPDISLMSASGQKIPILKEALVILTMGECRVRTWAIVANITEELILGLDVLYGYGVVVDLRRHVLLLGDEEVPLRHPLELPGSVPYTAGKGK
jgi:predicted aspartyl protease